MKLRTKFVPRSYGDLAATIFLLICIPLTFWFELTIVVPEFHQIGSLYYSLTLVAASFILFNIVANWMGTIVVDTSIKGQIFRPPEDPDLAKHWRLCSVCETLAPPRSWHCDVCQICILKRDHHCMFSGYCIGHKNHRYFLMFVAYLSLGTAYATLYNSVFFWWIHWTKLNNILTFAQLLMPCLVLLNNSDLSYYLLLYVLNIVGVAFGFALLIFHMQHVLKGSVVHERNENAKYDLGWCKNLEMVLGKRWYITWISPFVESELPHDGIHWENIVLESEKNR